MRAAIDACVAVQARQTLEETRWLLELADAHPFVAGVIGWIDLQADDAAEQLERFVDHPKFVGVRHIVQAEPDDRFMLRPAFCRGISLLEDRDLTYDILIYPKHLAGRRRARRRDSRGSVSCSTIWRSRTFAQARCGNGKKGSASSRHFRWCSASCRGS